jgi:gamma-glutamylputrescine oxidase
MRLDILHANDRQGKFPASWYAATVDAGEPDPPLTGAHSADVCIIGAGYTGLSAALHLAQAGFDVVVLDAHRAGWGASGRNGGQVGSGQRVGQDDLERMLGQQAARRMWELGQEAQRLVAELIGRHGIECDKAHGILHCDHKPRYTAHTREEVRKLREEYGHDAIRFLDREELRGIVASPDYHSASYDTAAFHIHPLKYALGLAEAARQAGARLHANSQVREIVRGEPATVRTATGEVRARHVILACNGYGAGLLPETASRIMPINNFIAVTAPLGETGARALIANNAAVADSRFVINYFRLTPDHRLLFGGGENYGYRFPADIKAFVRKPMLGVFPQLAGVDLDYGWGGTLAITVRRLPALLRIGPNILAAGGYSGHGVSIATLSGKVLAEAVRGETERFGFLSGLPATAFPGGQMLRWPLLALAMTWYAMRDRL